MREIKYFSHFANFSKKCPLTLLCKKTTIYGLLPFQFYSIEEGKMLHLSNISPNEANQFALIKILSHTPHISLFEKDGAFWVTSRSTTNFPNGVFLCPPQKSVVAHIVKEMNTGNLPPMWQVSPASQPDKLIPHLYAHGLTKRGEYLAMRLDTANARQHKQPIYETEKVVEITDETGLHHWAGVVLHSQETKEQIQAFANLFRYAQKRYPTAFRFFILQDRGCNVSAALRFVDNGIPGIYWVATPPEFRQKGYASRLMEYIVSQICAEDFTTCVLHATPKAVPIYWKLGFRDEWRYEVFTPHSVLPEGQGKGSA